MDGSLRLAGQSLFYRLGLRYPCDPTLYTTFTRTVAAEPPSVSSLGGRRGLTGPSFGGI